MGEPDRCLVCFDKWKNTSDAVDYLKEINKNDEAEFDEYEFTCESCSTVQGKNNCELCDVDDVCEECYGQGGDYGPGEIWVCHECLPICLECEAPLYTADDECCGKGRSDETVEEAEPTISHSTYENDVDAPVVESVTEQTEPMVDDTKMVDCTGCDNSVLLSDTHPFTEDRFICEDCIDTAGETYHLYNLCNKCDKIYYVTMNNWDMNDEYSQTADDYDGDVCYLCLPGILLNN
jgi:hypothetical protein